MATFEEQVEGLTQIDITGSSAPTQDELTEFLTDGRKEVISYMPERLKTICSTERSFTSSPVGSEGETITSGYVTQVTRADDSSNPIRCRQIPASLRGRANDSSEMIAATQSDPVYYILGNTINVLPASGGCEYLRIEDYEVTYNIGDIPRFPEEAEYLVVLYAAIKSLQAAMADKSGNSDINSALTLLQEAIVSAEAEIEDADKMVANILLGTYEVTESAADTDRSSSPFKTAADEITSALAQINSHNFADEDTFLTDNSQLTRVKDALDKAQETITGDQPSTSTDARGAQANEDTEIVTSALNIAQTEIQRAQAHLSEWSTILQGITSQAQGFANELQARGVWTSAKAQVWNGYFASANAYAQASQAFLASAQSSANEIQTRLAVDSTEYSWMEKQQAKLQADYEKGIQIMRGS